MFEKYIFLLIGENVVRLKTSINVDALKELKEQIILKCSSVKKGIQEERIGHSLYDYEKDDHYRNVKINVIQHEYRDAGYGYDDKPEISTATYDYYDYPRIVDQISEILKGNFGEELGFNISFDETATLKQNPSIEKVADEINKLLRNQNLSQKEMMKKFTKLKEKYEEVEQYIQNPGKAEQYYKKIFDCFIQEKLCSFDLKSIKQTFDFMKIPSSNFESKLISIDSLDLILQQFILKRIKEFPNTEEIIAEYLESKKTKKSQKKRTKSNSHTYEI